MFGIGGPELVVILIVGLIFIGPDKLPQVAKTVGGGLRDLRRAANLAQAELRETVDDLIREADLDEIRRDAPAPKPPKQPASPTPPANDEATPFERAHSAAVDDAPSDAETAVADGERDEAKHEAKDAHLRPTTRDTQPTPAASAGPEGVPGHGPVASQDAAVGLEATAQIRDGGFTFDDDPDDWDPDNFNDSAEPRDQDPIVAVQAPSEPVLAPTSVPTDAEVAADPPNVNDDDAISPIGTLSRSMPPMRRTDAPPTSPPPSEDA